MSDRLTFACSQCQSEFSIDRRLLGQTLACPSCGALCPLPREAVEIPPHDPRTTDRLLEVIAAQQRIANEHLSYLSIWLVRVPLAIAGIAAGVWLLALLGTLVGH